MSALHVSPKVIPALVGGAFLSAWIAGTWFTIPSFAWATTDVPRPDHVATVDLSVRGMRCRKTSQGIYRLLFERTDENRVEGYLRAIVYPSTGAGRLELTYDPARTDLDKVARAIGWDENGSQTPYTVVLDLQADLGSPSALLHSLALALEHQNEQLFDDCHVAGAHDGVDFAKLGSAWKDLFLEDLVPAGKPDDQGRIRVQGVSVGDKIPLEDLAPGIGPFVLEKSGSTWRIKKADWAKMAESGF